MKNLPTLVVLCAVASWSNSFAQYTDWVNYTNGQLVCVLADNGNELWIGACEGGLVKLDKATEQMTFYNHANSGLPHNAVWALVVDGNNTWIGTENGLAKFDGSNWTTYDTNNSGLPGNIITALAIDNGNIWIGTNGDGLAMFDGSNWTTYDTSHFYLLNYTISCLLVDGDEIWFGTSTYSGEGVGLGMFDGADWAVYNARNSGLPDDWVFAVAVDGSGNTWSGTWQGGLAAYREGGVIIDPVVGHVRRGTVGRVRP